MSGPGGSLNSLDLCNCIKFIGQSPVIISCENGQVVMAEYVMLTVSLGVLKMHKNSLFTPSLPPWKSRAIDSFSFGTIDRYKVHYFM